VVSFEPFVSIRDIGNPGKYDVNGLLPMISTISSKFNKVMVKNLGQYGTGRADNYLQYIKDFEKQQPSLT